MNGALLRDAFGHHAWATLQILDACAALDEFQLASEVPGTYGSVLETLRHLVGADRSYLFVLTGGHVTEIDESDMDLPALRAAAEACGPGWAWLLEQDLDSETEIVRHRDDGTDSSAPLGIRLAQALHHGTDHRSQICTALSVLGIEPPDIDAWAFAWKDGRLRETPSA